MAVNLLIAIQEMAATRGMTLAALARASGMQPSNLRRMLKSTTASPHLGSVMRLLAPLRCRIGPAGATDPAELAAFLDDRRRHRGLAWEQLLEPGDVHGAKLAAVMMPNPERLPLDLVMRLADALGATLVLVEAESLATAPTGAPAPRRARPRGSSQHIKPPRASPPKTAAPQFSPAASSSPVDPRPPVTPPVQATTPPRSDPLPPLPSAGPSLSPLCPPRLGRYRDAPPGPVPPRLLPATWIPAPRTPGFEVALLERIGDLTLDDLRESFAIALEGFAKLKSIPLGIIAGTANLLHAGFSRRRPPPLAPPAEPSAGCFDALDPRPIWKYWKSSKLPDYHPIDSRIEYDSLGMLASHVALDQNWAVVIRLAPSGQAHRLFAVLTSNSGEVELHSQPNSPLEIHVDGELHAFRHVRSGPVFGELEVSGRVYLVAAVAALLVVIEGRGDTARVVWGGRPEKLREVMVEMGSSTDEVEVEVASNTELSPALLELSDQLATAARQITEPDTAGRAAEVERAPAVTARQPLEDELAAERSARRTAEIELAGEREARQTAADALAATRTALEQEVEARATTERLAAETIGKLMALLGKRTEELATESELRAAAESRAAEAEQARDTLAAENAEALRMFEAYTEEQQRAMGAQMTQVESQLTRIEALKNEITAAREHIPSTTPAAPSVDRPHAKRAKDLSKKWRR